MRKIDISTNKHPNTFALVDDEDFDLLNKWGWCPDEYGHTTYAKSQTMDLGDGKKARFRMHRFVMGNPEGKVIDHIDGNGLNNQKANLRICTQSENMMNITRNKQGQSKYKGVHPVWRNKKKPWVASIRLNGKGCHLGYFKTEEEAAIAYNEAATKHYKEFACLNQI